jgi:hypothetical protein
MAQPERFEIVVLGSGAGGKLLAWHMPRGEMLSSSSRSIDARYSSVMQ